MNHKRAVKPKFRGLTLMFILSVFFFFVSPLSLYATDATGDRDLIKKYLLDLP